MIEEYRPYFNKWGLVEDRPGVRSDNAVRFTAEFLAAYSRKAVVVGGYGLGSTKIYQDMKDALKKYELKPGLLRRKPEHDRYENSSQDAPDNYISRVYISHLIGDSFCHRFLRYGKENKWGGVLPYYYKNGKGKWGSAWLGRQYQIIAAAQLVEGKTLGSLGRLSILVALVYASLSKQQDSKALGWMLKEVVKSHGLMKTVVSLFERKMKEHYSGGYGMVLQRYLQDKNHPSIKHLWNVY